MLASTANIRDRVKIMGNNHVIERVVKHKKFKRQEHGFTMVELLIVLALLAVLVAVVVVGVVGFMGRGAQSGYNMEKRNLKTAVGAFYSDKHVYDPANGWNEADSAASPDFRFPTSDGLLSDVYTGEALEIGGQRVNILMRAADSPAETTDVEDAAIWMGLLVNAPGSGASGTDVAPGDKNSPLAGENGLYIFEVPKSCSIYNYSLGKGTYTWIVDKLGTVYGVFPFDNDGDGVDEWYVGFSGAYP